MFVHIRAGEQRALAETIASVLSASGVAVPRIERLDVGPARTELRYYRERERAEVEQMARVAREQGIDVTPRYMRGRENDARIRPRTYELWLAP